MKNRNSILLPSLFLIGMVFFNCGNGQENQNQQITSSNEDDEGFVSIFDGKTLEGWDGDPTYWRVENGSIIGELTEDTPLKSNTFLIWQGGEPADFELKGEFKISESGNSGINYRSEKVEEVPYALRGYQADIDGKNSYTGQNYEERKRTTLAYRGQVTTIHPQEKEGDLRANIERNAWLGLEVTGTLGDRDSLKNLIHQEEWNDFHLVIKGNRLQHYVNGVLMSEVTDEDPVNRSMKGLMGIQVHVGPPMTVELKNLYIKEM